MKVLVDTCIWSRLLRRPCTGNNPVVQDLNHLIIESLVRMIGPIRQELLSGIKNRKQYRLLKEHLRAFPDLELETGDYETAAQMSNDCRLKGIQGSPTDFLICAVADRYSLEIFTEDRDFELFSRHIPIKLYRHKL